MSEDEYRSYENYKEIDPPEEMNLKTLKDLDLINTNVRYVLKAEAIKRYNFFNKERERLKNGSKIWLVLTGRIEEIIEMNNLTEEDLKEEIEK